MSQPKRHHFLPKFYLRRFADHKRRIRRYERGSKKPIVMSVINAAVETGFYTITEESGTQSQKVEALLSRIEQDAAAAVERLLKGHFPPSPADRESLALFIAFQIMRTPEQRHEYELMVDYAQKLLLENWTADYARQRLSEAGLEPTDEAVADVMDVVENPDKFRFVPHPNEHILLMLSIATAALAPVILDKSWLLGHCRNGTFVTSDHPIAYYRTPAEQNRLLGVGLTNAEEVYYPLGRYHVLMLVPPGTLSEIVMPLTREHALFVNWLVASSSYRWVFQHPDDDLVNDIIPDSPRPMMDINGTPIFPSWAMKSPPPP